MRIQEQRHMSLISRACKVPSRLLRYPTREFQEAPKRAQEAPTMTTLGSTWPILGSSWLHLYNKIYNFVWERFHCCTQPHNYTVACNMSPLGRRRGPALRAESTGVLNHLQTLQTSSRRSLLCDRPFRKAAPTTPGFTRVLRGLLPKDCSRPPQTAPEPSKMPSKSHLGALKPHPEGHLRHLRPSWHQDRLKMPTQAQLGPAWAHLGPNLAQHGRILDSPMQTKH